MKAIQGSTNNASEAYASQLWRTGYSAGEYASGKHRDHRNGDKSLVTASSLNSERIHIRRFLLEAEPQIGKTGTALWVAIQLHFGITRGMIYESGQSPSELPNLARVSLPVDPRLCRTPLQWKYPYGLICKYNLSKMRYSDVAAGKYHVRMFISRIKLLEQASTVGADWADRFATLTKVQEDIQAGQTTLETHCESLPRGSLSGIVKFETTADGETRFSTQGFEKLISIVDWDGRLTTFGKRADESLEECALRTGLLRSSEGTYMCDICDQNPQTFYHF